MPKVNVETPSSHSKEKTFEIVQSLLSNDADLKKIDPNYSCEFNAANCSGKIYGSKFDAEIEIKEQSVSMTVEIPFMLSPFKGQIKDNLEKKLTQALS